MPIPTPAEYAFPADRQPPPARGSFFGEQPYLVASCSDGILRNRVGHRLVALNDDFILGFREALLEECGPAAAEVMYSCGVRFGALTGAYVESAIGEHIGQPIRELSLAHFHALLADLFASHGWGLLRFDLGCSQRGLILAEVRNPAVGEMCAGEVIAGNVEELMAGFLAGIYGHFAGRELVCRQLECVTRGASAARFVIASEARLEPAEELMQDGAPGADILAALLARAA